MYFLAIELVGPSQRVVCTIILNIAYSIGLVLLAIIVYFVRDWRYLSLAVSVPLSFIFLCFFVLPESPRWLIATGNYRQAAKLMKTIAKYNGETIPDDYEDVLRQKLKRTPIPIISSSMDNIAPAISIGMLDLFRTPNMRAKTLIITFIWFSNTCVYVGLSYYAPALGTYLYIWLWRNKIPISSVNKFQKIRWRWNMELFPSWSCWIANVYFPMARHDFTWSSVYFVQFNDGRWCCVFGHIFGATQSTGYAFVVLHWKNGHIVGICCSAIGRFRTVSNRCTWTWYEF